MSISVVAYLVSLFLECEIHSFIKLFSKAFFQWLLDPSIQDISQFSTLLKHI